MYAAARVESERPPRARRSPKHSEREREPRGSSDSPAAPTIRKVRSEHGTRVARSITCSACGAKDTIHFAPKDPKRALCRRCAADLLGAVDPDTNVSTPKPYTCAQCGRTGTTDRPIADPREFLCPDCFRGIETKQGNKAKTGTAVSKGVLRVRRTKPET